MKDLSIVHEQNLVNKGFMDKFTPIRSSGDGIFSSAINTFSVAHSARPFRELAIVARAAAALHLSIAQKSGTEESRSVASARAFSEQVEKQIAMLNCIPEIVALLADIATEPTRRKASFPGVEIPEWAILFAGRAETALRHMRE